MTNVAIIGCGKIANSHVQALAQMEDVRIAAVCDLNEVKCRQLAKKVGAEAYTSYEEMLESERLQLAIICLPPAFHGECARYCAGKGVNIFLEKPMGVDAADCRSIIDACKANGVMLWVGHMQRYSMENRIARELVESGEYGRLLAINEVRTCGYPGPNSPEWLMKREISGGGIMYNFGAHTLDMIKYISGSRVVLAESSVNFSSGDSENVAIGFLKLENGVSATFNLVGSCSVNRYEIVLYLTEGEIRIKPRRSIVACGRDGVFQKIADAEDAEASRDKNWQYLQLRDVIDSLKTGEAKVTGEYGLEIIENIESLYASAGRK
ncbi:MAG: Gfo/Idh/MocA family oxidoreductase [Oscillospiraceae bacterium]|nr:Gfo/Idh/MocA family oxidoreductase [Oscillospiraceae bacterium]